MNIQLAIAAIIAALSFGGAWKIQDWRYGAMEATRVEAKHETERLRAKTADTASEAHEKVRTVLRTEFQTIYQEVPSVIEKPIYHNVCFDDDGLRILAKAIGNKPATGQPASPVPTTD